MAPRTSWRGLLVALCVTIVLVTAACGDDPDDKATPVPTTTQPKTTTTEPTTTEPRATETSETEPAENSDEEQLRQLTEDWFQAARLIFAEESPVEAASNFISGAYLSGFTAEAQRRSVEGLAIRLDDAGVSSIVVERIELSGGVGTITQCDVDADALFRKSNGETLDDSVVAKRFRSRAEISDNGWRLVERIKVMEWEGNTECE